MENKKTSEVVLLLGSNQGDRLHYLTQSKGLLIKLFGVKPISSAIIETKAMGFSGADFLNQIVIFKTKQSPFIILRQTQEIEKTIGRKSKSKNGIYQDRVIDIDILFYDDWILNSPSLQIPHPQVFERPFVSSLLRDISHR